MGWDRIIFQDNMLFCMFVCFRLRNWGGKLGVGRETLHEPMYSAECLACIFVNTKTSMRNLGKECGAHKATCFSDGFVSIFWYFFGSKSAKSGEKCDF